MRYVVLLLSLGLVTLYAKDLMYFCPADSSKDSHYIIVDGKTPQLTVMYVSGGGRNLAKAEGLLKLKGKAEKNGSMVFGKEPFKAPYFYIPKNRVGISFKFVDKRGAEQNFSRLSCQKL